MEGLVVFVLNQLWSDQVMEGLVVLLFVLN